MHSYTLSCVLVVLLNSRTQIFPASRHLRGRLCLHRRAVGRHRHAARRLLAAVAADEGSETVLGEICPHPLLLRIDPAGDRRQHNARSMRHSPCRPRRPEVRVISGAYRRVRIYKCTRDTFCLAVVGRYLRREETHAEQHRWSAFAEKPWKRLSPSETLHNSRTA